ncbi:hypothetical protein SSCG_03832 [Streptomyces clavuligerus]|nr:hypothetical protein SSCG_03832 [Streptomyces clavuligerus]
MEVRTRRRRAPVVCSSVSPGYFPRSPPFFAVLRGYPPVVPSGGSGERRSAFG